MDKLLSDSHVTTRLLSSSYASYIRQLRNDTSIDDPDLEGIWSFADALNENNVARLFLDCSRKAVTTHAEEYTRPTSRSELLHHIERLQTEMKDGEQLNRSQMKIIKILTSAQKDASKNSPLLVPHDRSLVNDVAKSNEGELAAYRVMFDVQQENLRWSRLRLKHLENSLLYDQSSDSNISYTNESSQLIYSTFVGMQARIGRVRKQLQTRLGEPVQDKIDGDEKRRLVLKAIEELESLEVAEICGGGIGSPRDVDAFPLSANNMVQL